MAVIPATQDKACLRVLNEVYEAAARPRDRDVRHYLGMSEIGGECDRALWYSFRSFPTVPLEGRVIMLFRFGDLIESELVHFLNKAGYAVTDQQLSFNAIGGHFGGHCDGIIHGITQEPHILECKSANRRSFDAFRQGGVRATQPKYYCQCQCYMGYSGLDRALMAIQCKEDSAIYFERIYFNRSEFQTLNDRATLIIYANEPFARPFKMESRECEWCKHRTYCWYPEENTVSSQVCGTCRYFAFKGLKKVCRHPEHVVEIMQWGVGCPQWVEFDSKERRVDPVELEQITL